MSISEAGGMQKAALERKLKLQSLRERYQAGPGAAGGSPERDEGDEGESSAKRARASGGVAGEEQGERPSLSFRNYKPSDQNLKDLTVPDGRPERFDDQVKETLSKEAVYDPLHGIDLAALAPKKPDWDLKRDVSRQLDKLERRTQKAIVHLIRERLGGQEDKLAELVATVGENQDKSF